MAQRRSSARFSTLRLVCLSVLLTICAVNAPWRLSVLAIETLVMRPGHLRTPRADENDNYWRARDLESRLTHLGWTVQYEPDSPYYYGITRFQNRSITINESLSWDGKFAILAHEGAHALQPARLTQEQSEIFAESVAALVVGPRVRESARYLAGLKGDILTMGVYWQEIYRVAGILEP